MTKVLVLAGGASNEREVSLRSGMAVTKALQKSGYEVDQYDPVVDERNLSAVAKQYDVVFPALHGAGGEDGTIQEELERLHIPYVGSGVKTSELCFDKWNYRELLASHQLPIAPGALVDNKTLANSPLITQPFVLKPPRGGSSIDTILVRDVTALPTGRIEETFSRYPQLLLEKLIVGTEITVGVVGDKALPVIEIIPPANGEFDYDNKYNGKSQELCPPQNVRENIQIIAQQLAEQIHHLCGCRDMSRTDIMIEADGSLTVLETNTIPGLTDQSLLPKAAEAAGVSMAQLCDSLVKTALRRQTATS